MTLDEFLPWSAQQAEGRYELVRGEIQRMPSEGGRHNILKVEVLLALREAVAAAGLGCHVFTDGMVVRINDRQGREPDASVTAGPVADFDKLEVVDPLIVVEVMSPNSINRDTVKKLVDYFRVPSIEHYLIVDHEDRHVVHHRRLPGGSGEILTRTLFSGLVRFDPPGIAISVDRILAAVPNPAPAVTDVPS